MTPRPAPALHPWRRPVSGPVSAPSDLVDITGDCPQALPGRIGHTTKRQRRFRLRLKALIGVLTISAAPLVASTAPAHAEPANCSPFIAIGIPGSEQSVDHAAVQPDRTEGLYGTDGESLYGKEVNSVLDEMTAQLGDALTSVHISYPAELDPITAKINYNASEYKASKDAGYNAAYQELKNLSTLCRTSKFFLLGYSQGAHIAGDLAQTVFNKDKGAPVDPSRISGVVLIADPAYNSTSPGTHEFVYTDDQVWSDSDHWTIHGALGTRGAFEQTDPVVSVCIYGDPVCDANSVGAGGYNGINANAKKWMHTELYTDHAYADSPGIAEWLGKTIADRARN